MLDVEIFKGCRFTKRGLLDYRIFTKETSIWRPLSPWSAHPGYALRAWPISQCIRFYDRCSDRVEGINQLERSREMLKQQGIFVQISGREFDKMRRTRMNSRRQRLSERSWWMVLPFSCSVPASSIRSVLRDVHIPSSLSFLGEPRVSWCLGDKH